jgi:hypothetical protein
MEYIVPSCSGFFSCIKCIGGMQMEFIRIYCQEKNDPNLVTRNKCKKKNSLVVYGKPAA